MVLAIKLQILQKYIITDTICKWLLKVWDWNYNPKKNHFTKQKFGEHPFFFHNIIFSLSINCQELRKRKKSGKGGFSLRWCGNSFGSQSIISSSLSSSAFLSLQITMGNFESRMCRIFIDQIDVFSNWSTLIALKV